MDKEWIEVIVGIVGFCVVTYVLYWIFKTVSYEIFYEGMVTDTIKETVKQSCLIP